MDTRVATLAHF